VLRVSTDSRSIQPGDLFIALRGEKFDGVPSLHRRCNKRRRRRAGCRAGARDRVGDPRGRYPSRPRPPGRGLARTIQPAGGGITGSNGKTTVKKCCGDFAGGNGSDAACSTPKATSTTTSACADAAASTRDASICRAGNGHEHAGEIDYLTHLARPDVRWSTTR